MEFMSKPLRPLDFDTAATTVVAPELLACRVAVLAGVDANPSSTTRPPGQAAGVSPGSINRRGEVTYQ